MMKKNPCVFNGKNLTPEKQIFNNIFAYTSEIAKSFGLRKIFNPEGSRYYYAGVVATGEFDENDDYNRGVMWMTIDVVQYPSPSGIQVLFSIGNIDDGLWQAWSNTINTPAEAYDLIDKLYEEFKDVIKLQDAATVNRVLYKFGMYGTYTG